MLQVKQHIFLGKPEEFASPQQFFLPSSSQQHGAPQSWLIVVSMPQTLWQKTESPVHSLRVLCFPTSGPLCFSGERRSQVAQVSSIISLRQAGQEAVGGERWWAAQGTVVCLSGPLRWDPSSDFQELPPPNQSKCLKSSTLPWTRLPSSLPPLPSFTAQALFGPVELVLCHFRPT